MTRDPLTRAWFALLVLTAVSAGVAMVLPGLDATATRIAGAVILLVSWSKARLILGRYLDLDEAPRVWRAFEFVLGLVVLGFLGLYLAASGVPATP